MWNTFKYTILSLVKEKNILIWAFAFPLILASIFNAMFANLDEGTAFEPIPVAIVDNTSYRAEEAFVQMVEALAEPGEAQMLVPQTVESDALAQQLLKDGSVLGIYQVDGNGTPALTVSNAAPFSYNMEGVKRTILKDLLDNYLHKRIVVEGIAAENPAALANPSFIESLYTQESYTEEISITANNVSGSIRYFYALLGFAAIMCAQIAMLAVVHTQSNLSRLGARRAVGATTRTQTLAATLLASWLLSFICLLVAFCYMRFVLGIDFGRDAASLFALVIAALMTTALGALLGAIPKLNEGTKMGIHTGLSCLLALFAGLYGEPAMELADTVARSAPALQTVNPARQVTDLFYSLYYYDGYEHFFGIVLILLGITAVLFAGAALLMRRQRYASL